VKRLRATIAVFVLKHWSSVDASQMSDFKAVEVELVLP
jgi:hypothetical protein